MVAYTRRDKRQLTPEIMGEYHALVMQGDLAEFEKFLMKYPHIGPALKAELIADFKVEAEKFRQYAATNVRRRWLDPR